MKKYIGILFVLGFFIFGMSFVEVEATNIYLPGCTSFTGYSTTTGLSCKPSVAIPITADFKVNGEDEHVLVSLGDILHVTWTSQGASGCEVYSELGKFTVNGLEWIGTVLPPSGSADVTVSKWGNGDVNSLSFECFSGSPGNWGDFSKLKDISLADKFTTNAIVAHPVITSLSPSSGPVGTKVTITGSGFTNNNEIDFIGNTNFNLIEPSIVSPVEGSKEYIGVSSTDGKTLTFIIPFSLTHEANGDNPLSKTTYPSVVPGVYSVLVLINGEHSNISDFKVTTSGQESSFIPTKTSSIFNRRLIFGFSGQDVGNLQKMLGISPVTKFFGKTTLGKVKEFQCKYISLCSGSNETNGYGSVGPKTALKLQEIFGN